MYAHRQIYEDIQASIPVPLELQHRKTEVIFVVLEEPVEAQPVSNLGDTIASFFKDIPPATCLEEEFVLPTREHYPPTVTFDE